MVQSIIILAVYMLIWYNSNYIQNVKIVFKCCHSGIYICTCCSILTCVIHVSCNSATCIHQFNWFVIYVFVCVLIFYMFPFRQLNAGSMTLPTSDRWQCYPNEGQHVKWI